MNNHSSVAAAKKPGTRFARRCRRTLLASTALCALVCLQPDTLRAQDATWLATPIDPVYNNTNNWNPTTVPAGTAFFGASSITNISIQGIVSVGGWTFNAEAPAYSFVVAPGAVVLFVGAGIVNNGGSTVTITNNNKGLAGGTA